MTLPPTQPSSFKRRDHIICIESEVLASEWDSSIFDANPDYERESFFVTFPFPYMNGRLHLGHAFSLSKSEFQARFQRLLGKNVLWPMGFHGTGMPIAACADRLKHELNPEDSLVALESSAEEEENPAAIKTSYGSKKSKAAAKSDSTKTQAQILLGLGIPEKDLSKFTDPKHWLKYFPPLAVQDLRQFGLSVDWRRSFVTTDINPYFDAFVRWQYNTLKKLNKVKFGLRPVIFSRIDNQPCADHDRASGETVNPQEYTLIKIKVLKQGARIDALTAKYGALRSQCPIYLVAATLRPETMYGQTNCFVQPNGQYQIVVAFDHPNDYSPDLSSSGSISVHSVLRDPATVLTEPNVCLFVCSPRSALNMCHQGLIPAQQDIDLGHGDGMKPISVCDNVSGIDLIGLKLSAPLSRHKIVYALPMPTVSMEKGTGIVTSVPSDSPDDYMMLKDLRTKEKLRTEFHVDPTWLDIDIIDVVEIPEYGKSAAVTLCEKLKVSSYKDAEKLRELKQDLYQKGFYNGIMATGPYFGESVKVAKDLIRRDMVKNQQAVSYYEPEKKVVSRSGDNCIVALCRQWYSDFGDKEWTDQVLRHVESDSDFSAFGQQQEYINKVKWLDGWACSRSYGLGTLLPWERENKIVIESLSDSTIYFAYYTIAHFLQGNLFGSQPGTFNIDPDQMTDAAFDFVFLDKEKSSSFSPELQTKLDLMKSEFKYWYPMNLRCSGKDLIPNHLTMALFHHAAIWQNPAMWPRAYYVNGHLMLDSAKMSKSTGNFLTLEEAIQSYSADVTRLTLADAGDSMDDANFERTTANACIMKLYLALKFIEAALEDSKLRFNEINQFDIYFVNEINYLSTKAKQAYESMAMRDALKNSFYEMLTLKDTYKHMLGPNQEMHRNAILYWIQIFCVIVSPIACFSAEFIWRKLLNQAKSVSFCSWPDILSPKFVLDHPEPLELLTKRKGNPLEPDFDHLLHSEFKYITEIAEECTQQIEKILHGGKKGTEPKQHPDELIIFCATEYPEWQQKILTILAECVELNPEDNSPVNPKFMDTGVKEKISNTFINDKKTLKNAMAFASYQVKDQAKKHGLEAFNLKTAFDEKHLLTMSAEFLVRSTGVQRFAIGSDDPIFKHKQDTAVPGRPSIAFS